MQEAGGEVVIGVLVCKSRSIESFENDTDCVFHALLSVAVNLEQSFTVNIYLFKVHLTPNTISTKMQT